MAVYAQVSAAVKKDWNKIPSSGEQNENLSQIRHGPDELFQVFVSRLMKTSRGLIGDAEAGRLADKQRMLMQYVRLL